MARRLVLAAAALVPASCSDVPPTAPAADPAREAARAAITDYARLLIVERSPEEAFSKYFADLLIQHDPWIADGGKGDAEFLRKRREAEPEKYAATEQYVNVVHNILAEGDLVALKSHVFTGPTDKGREFVDIWRIENGRFVEHWDVIRPIGDERAKTVGCGVGGTYGAALEAGDTVAKPACGARDPAIDSDASRKVALDALGRQPGRRIERVIADGDLVLVHSRATSAANPRGIAYADLFRVKNGKAVDRWHVAQPIPEFSASGRSMTGGRDDPLEPGRHAGGPQAH